MLPSRDDVVGLKDLVGHRPTNVAPDDVDIAVSPEVVTGEMLLEEMPVRGLEVADLVFVPHGNDRAEDTRCPVAEFGHRKRDEPDIWRSGGRRRAVGEKQRVHVRVEPAGVDEG